MDYFPFVQKKGELPRFQLQMRWNFLPRNPRAWQELNGLRLTQRTLLIPKAEQKRTGYMKELTNTDSLSLYAFVCDVRRVYSVFQTKIQSNQMTLEELDKSAVGGIASMEALKNGPLLGGWEEAVLSGVTIGDDNRTTFMEFPLWTRHVIRQNKFVLNKRPFETVWAEVLNKLIEFFESRMRVDSASGQSKTSDGFYRPLHS